MKFPLIAVLALATAMPMVSIPTVSDAQVLTGRGRATPPRRAPRPALSPAEEDRLFEAQDLVMDLSSQIEDLQDAGEAAGGLTPEQTAQIQQHTARRTETQQIVDRLEAKRDRRS